MQRDQNVTLIYQTAGLYLTVGGKAMEGGTEGDVVTVLNLQSKRTVSGTVVGRNQVAIQVATPRLPATADASATMGANDPAAAPVAVAASTEFAIFSSVSKGRVMFMYRFKRIFLAGTMLGVVSIAGGCSSIDRLAQIGEKPKLTAMEDPTAQPGYKPVQMPMPKPEAVSYNANSLWRNGSRSFFKDQRAHQIGDLLTVTVNITDQANFANETQRSRANKEEFGDYRLRRRQDAGRAGAEDPAGPHPDRGLDRLQRRQGFDPAPGKPADQRRRRGHATLAQRQPRGRGQAGDPRQPRNARTDRRRHRAPRRHPERQHHRLLEDRAGPHLLRRPRPDHRRAATALRPTGDGCAAAVLRWHEPEKWEPVFGISSCPNKEYELPHLNRGLRRDVMYYAASVSSPGGGRGRFGGAKHARSLGVQLGGSNAAAASL